MIDLHELRKNIKKLVTDTIITEENRDKVKSLFSELMKDKEAWDRFISIVVPSMAKELQDVSTEDFQVFKKITFEVIDEWKP